MKIKSYEEKTVLIKGKEKIFKYYKARIPKGNGKFREIYIPLKEYAEHLRSYLPHLSQLLKQNDTLKLNHAFVDNRSCVTNALKHIGYNYCLSFDLKDFFDHITREHLEHLVPPEILDIALIDGSPRQGLPTSPILSNLAFLKIDEEIYYTILELDDVIYTRYADDLCFSFNDINIKKILNRKIKKIIEGYQFEINEKKTKFQSRKNGNIIITGISTTPTHIRPTRKTLKKLRAAEHKLKNIVSKNTEEITQIRPTRKIFRKFLTAKNNPTHIVPKNKEARQERIINGLKEWIKCKPPKKYLVKNKKIHLRENLSIIDTSSINQINIIFDLIKNKYINKNDFINSKYLPSTPKKLIDIEISRLINKKIISYDNNGNYQLNPNVLLEISIKKL